MQYFLILFLSFQLYAENIKKVYYINGNDIYLSTLFSNVTEDKKIFSIDPNRYTKKIKASQLQKTLNFYGYKNIQINSSYINFIKKSPINLSNIEKKIREYYQKNYLDIKIMDISIAPIGYIESLPKEYTVLFKNKSYLHSEAIFSIKSLNSKQLFFHYKIKAQITVYKARNKIIRNEEISSINVVKDSIILDKFGASPLQNIDEIHLQSKHNLKKGAIIRQRDLTTLTLVKRDAQLIVTMKNSGFNITFSAIALQDGKYGSKIRVKRENGKVLVVKVIGKNKAEIK